MATTHSNIATDKVTPLMPHHQQDNVPYHTTKTIQEQCDMSTDKQARGVTLAFKCFSSVRHPVTSPIHGGLTFHHNGIKGSAANTLVLGGQAHALQLMSHSSGCV